MGTLEWLTIAFLGLGLAASSGLNTFLPLLGLAAVAKFGAFGIELNDSFAWLGSDTALGILALATVVEIAADKIPTVDHALDVMGTLARPAAGTLATASVFHGTDPAVAATMGLIIGAPTAFGFHAAKAGTRAVSTATTFGIGNPVLSFFEDAFALLLIAVAFIIPLLVPVFVLLAVFAIAKIAQLAKRKLATRPAPPPPSAPV